MGIFSSLSRVFADKDTCPDCKGTGYITFTTNYKSDRYSDVTNNTPLKIEHQTPTKCYKCEGTGKKKAESP